MRIKCASVPVIVVLLSCITLSSFAEPNIIGSSFKQSISTSQIVEGHKLNLYVTFQARDTQDYLLQFPKNPELYAFLLDKVHSSYKIEEKGSEKLITYELKFVYSSKTGFNGKQSIDPFQISLSPPDLMQDSIGISTTKEEVDIIPLAQVALISNIITIGIIVVTVLLIAGIVVILVTTRRKRAKRIKEQPQILTELTFKEFVAYRDRYGFKDPATFLKFIEKLLEKYLLQKTGVKKLNQFYHLEALDQEFVKEVKRFLKYVETLKFSGERLSETKILEIEEDFKTILFVTQ